MTFFHITSENCCLLVNSTRCDDILIDNEKLTIELSYTTGSRQIIFDNDPENFIKISKKIKELFGVVETEKPNSNATILQIVKIDNNDD